MNWMQILAFSGIALLLVGVLAMRLSDSLLDEFSETHCEEEISKKWWASFAVACVGVLLALIVIIWNFCMTW